MQVVADDDDDILIERSKYDDDDDDVFLSKDQNVMMIMIDRSEYDDDDVADRTVKVLKMLLIERVQVLKMSLLIERSKC